MNPAHCATTYSNCVSDDLQKTARDSLDALSYILNDPKIQLSYEWGQYMDCGASYSFTVPNTTKEEISSMDKTAKSEESKKPTVNITENLEAEFAFTYSGLDIKRVIFSDPCTIILWKDGTKTIVRVREGEEFSPYHGFCAAIAKKMFGSNNKLSKFVDQWTEKNEKHQKK